MSTIQHLLHRAEELRAVSESPRLDVELLLCHCLETQQSQLYAHPEQEVDAVSEDRFESLLARRRRGEPLAYLRGHQAFWKLELEIDARALMPRPETELLVETALQLLPATPQRVAELGVGSGAVALALARERPDWQILATDLSRRALSLAAQNHRRLGLHNVQLVCADWCAGLRRHSFAMILCNPPYVDVDDPVLDRPPLCYEPRLALAAGLRALDTLVRQAVSRLQKGGFLLLEHAPWQAGAVRRRLRAHHYREVRTMRDLNRKPRLSIGRVA